MLRRARETEVVMSLIQGVRVLDVGCGNGRYLELLKSAGFSPVGVELNPATVDRMRSEGYEVYTPDEFLGLHLPPFETVLMSHVLEHMMPREMATTMDSYLGHVVDGGSLVVATPLLYPGFYDDYDHVRPYPPRALEAVFGANDQVQQTTAHRLQLEHVWFRRSARFKRIHPGASGWMGRRMRRLFNIISYRLFSASGGRVGWTSGWVGRFSVERADNRHSP